MNSLTDDAALRTLLDELRARSLAIAACYAVKSSG
jgi:hypothetical protein